MRRDSAVWRQESSAQGFILAKIILFACLVLYVPGGGAYAEIPLSHSPLWFTEDGSGPTGVGWGDFDGDGWLDLAVANGIDLYYEATMVYFNHNGTLSTTAGWQSEDRQPSGNLYIGDLDNDGDLDMAVVNLGYVFNDFQPVPHVLYFNDNGLIPAPQWVSSPNNGFGVVLGDPDGDGDLDLVHIEGLFAADNLQATKMYINEQGVFDTVPGWQTDDLYYGNDGEFIDIDRDGDLDLVVTGRDMGVAVFYNHGGSLETTPSWHSLALGGGRQSDCADVDGDGYLDLAIAGVGGSEEYQGEFFLFMNNGGTFDSLPVWRCDLYGEPSCVSWADVDNDGDPDLAAGGWNNHLGIFENQGGVLSDRYTWSYLSSGLQVNIQQIDWGDYDADGLVDTVQEFATDGTVRLFCLARQPVHRLNEVAVNGQPVGPESYCCDLREGWFSFAQPPGAGVLTISYTVSRDLDLVVTDALSNRVRIFENQTVPDPEDISVLLMMCNAYGANYNIPDESLNIREQFENNRWKLTVVGVTDSVTPCSFAAGVGCPTLPVDVQVSDITNITDYDALVILPGENHNDILNSQEACDLVREAVDSGLVVAAWCRAVRVLAAVDVINGLEVVGHADYADEYEAAGAIYLGNDHPPVVQGNIITSVRGNFYRTAMCQAIAQTIDYFRSVYIDDEALSDTAYGDGDGVYEVGESIELFFNVVNNRRDSAFDVTAFLTVEDASIEILDGVSYIGDVPGRDTMSNAGDPMVVRIPDDYVSRIDSVMVEFSYNAGAYVDTFAFDAPFGQPHILIVDDEAGEGIAGYYTETFGQLRIPWAGWETAVGGVPAPADLAACDVVIWYTGNYRPDPLDAGEISALRDFLDGGGKLFMTGQGIAAGVGSADPGFLNDYLRCDYLSSVYMPFTYTTSGAQVFEYGDSLMIYSGDGANNQVSPDRLAVMNNGVGEMGYLASEDMAAISYDGAYQLVFFGFGFEAIRSDQARWTSRSEILSDILAFFAFQNPSQKPAVQGMAITPGDSLHLIDHMPEIAWSYYDAAALPQLSYQVQVSSDMDWSAAEMWDTGPVTGSESQVTYSGLLLEDNNRYFLRVRVFNGVLWSNWASCMIRLNSVPVPAGLTPDGMDAVSENPPVLSHPTAQDLEGDPLTYSYQLYADDQLGLLVEEAVHQPGSAGATTVWQVVGVLDEGEDYYWRVRCHDGYEDAPWSETASFMVPLPYICSDANEDDQVNIGDAVFLINYEFKGGPAPDPVCVGDANGDGETNVGDAVYLVNFIFKGGPPPQENCCP